MILEGERMMVEMNIYPITGLYQELYNPDLLSMAEPIGDNEGIGVLKNINSFFWAKILSEETIDLLLNIISEKRKHSTFNLKYEAVANNPKYFKKSVLEAAIVLSSHSLTQKEFFSYLETLQIFCNMYSEYISNPFTLTIEDGFDVDEISSETMINNALNPSQNPYYSFLKDNCKQIILEKKPNLIWLRGKIRLSTITLALFAKNANPNVHICVVGHSSEYYSLNKIVEYLKMNKKLFEVIDSIILDDDKNTMKNLYNCILNKQDLSSVNNILYWDNIKKEVIQTKNNITEKNIYDWTVTRRKNNVVTNNIAASQLANIRLWPNSRCFWNKCTFCGINKKYDEVSYGDSFSNVDKVIAHIENMYKNGCKYFWFIDEAIPPVTIEEFAKKLLEKDINIFWQIRSRIDYEYKNIDFNLLYKAGLREIRLGLETANNRIRKLMKKFATEIKNEYIEELVKKFNDSGISVHFPMIVGFPTETSDERYETYEFLEKLNKKYPLMTFNINILGLDVSSELFKKYYKFNISEIKFPCSPQYYLGNIVGWNCKQSVFNRELLDIERNGIMKKVLYPWMPTNCILPVFIFYRLSETSRNTLIWKCNDKEKSTINMETIIQISEANSIVDYKKNRIRLYNLSSHHLIEVDTIIWKLIKYIEKQVSVRDVINYMVITFKEERYDWNYYEEQIKKLLELGFIELKNDTTSNTVEE